MQRIFHRYELWEDYKNGMYAECKDGRNERVKQAASILGTAELCRKAMQKVVAEWKIATEYNFSNAGINRKAWLGQAACSCYAGIHEDETREAWGLMTDAQRNKANEIAQQIIVSWVKEQESQDVDQISLMNDWGAFFENTP